MLMRKKWHNLATTRTAKYHIIAIYQSKNNNWRYLAGTLIDFADF